MVCVCVCVCVVCGVWCDGKEKRAVLVNSLTWTSMELVSSVDIELQFSYPNVALNCGDNRLQLAMICPSSIT